MPSFLLPDRLEIQPYDGEGVHGPLLGQTRTVRAAVRPSSRLLVTDTGNQRQAAFKAVIRPEDGPVAVGSKVTWDGVEFRVLAAGAIPTEARASHRELVLG